MIVSSYILTIRKGAIAKKYGNDDFPGEQFCDRR